MTTPSANKLERVVMWPFKLVGLTGPDGCISFSKGMGVAVAASYFIRRPIPLGVALALLGASFGIKGFFKLLDARALTATETMQTTLDVAKVAEVLKRREPAAGIEPSP